MASPSPSWTGGGCGLVGEGERMMVETGEWRATEYIGITRSSKWKNGVLARKIEGHD
jgi:hypothetical protein